MLYLIGGLDSSGVEHWTENPCVVGSNPSLGIFLNSLMKIKTQKTNIRALYWRFNIAFFFFNFFYILLNNKELLNYWSLLCKQESIVVVGHSLYAHILSFFILTLIYNIVIHYNGFVFFFLYFLSSHFLLVFYFRAFKLYLDSVNPDIMYIEIPSDLLCRMFLFFLPISWTMAYITNITGTNRFLIFHILIAVLFLLIPTLKNTFWLVASYLVFELGKIIPFFFKKIKKWTRMDSNQQPYPYQGYALPIKPRVLKKFKVK